MALFALEVVEESACDHSRGLNPRRTIPKLILVNIFRITELQPYPWAGALRSAAGSSP